MRSTKGQLEEFFKESKIWLDICDELDKWLDDNHLMLEDPDGTMSLNDFKHHAAICTALRRFKAIGEYMLLDEELKEEEKKDG